MHKVRLEQLVFMKATIALTLICAVLFLLCLIPLNLYAQSADTDMSDQTVNQKIIEAQRQKIQELSAEVASLSEQNNGLMSQINQLEEKAEALMQDKISLQDALSSEAKSLITKPKSRLEIWPTLSASVMHYTNGLANCLRGNCRWSEAVESLPFVQPQILALNQFRELLYSKHFLPTIFSLIIILVICGILALFFAYNVLSRNRPSFKAKQFHHLTDEEVRAISGDDIHASKLDLVRAYIDMEDFMSAKNILQDVIEHGSKTQQTEAKELLKKIKKLGSKT